MLTKIVLGYFGLVFGLGLILVLLSMGYEYFTVDRPAEKKRRRCEKETMEIRNMSYTDSRLISDEFVNDVIKKLQEKHDLLDYDGIQITCDHLSTHNSEYEWGYMIRFEELGYNNLSNSKVKALAFNLEKKCNGIFEISTTGRPPNDESRIIVTLVRIRENKDERLKRISKQNLKNP